LKSRRRLIWHLTPIDRLPRTTKPPGEGTGLGLNISHSIIVQKHRGQITVVSEPGQTCFQVRLPLTLSG
jgi:signal transduction histidine kinase